MEIADLAKLLVESAPNDRRSLLLANGPIDTTALAQALQEMCYAVWTDDPQRVSMIVDVINEVADQTNDQEIRAFADWMEAIKSLVEGELERCVNWIDSSETRFDAIGKRHLAAKTQTSKLYALALLGRYDEAIECGRQAREIFVGHDDLYSAGKIEHNIGNLYWRRAMYRESEPYLESAHARFLQIDDQRQLAMVENCQAFVKTLQNQFRDAEVIYKSAHKRARANRLTVTEAEIETGLSNLYLFEGRYDLALKFMERSRQKYEQLEMPNQSAICELEIADIYLELNLLPEAASFYKKVGTRFADLGMQAELARCSLNHGRTLLSLRESSAAAIELDRAESLYGNEQNLVATGSVNLARAQMLLDSGHLELAEVQANKSIAAFETGENSRSLLDARWLRADIWAKLGRRTDAIDELNSALSSASGVSTQAEYLCRVSLGKLTGDESHLLVAIETVENSRAVLSSTELRTSFFEDKVAAYNELIKLKLSKGKFEEAFVWHERSRARTLSDEIATPRKGVESNDRLELIRQELTWYQNRINRSLLADADERRTAEGLRQEATTLEKEYAELRRRLSAEEPAISDGPSSFDLAEFRSMLGDSAFVEYLCIDGRVSAFVATKHDFMAFPDLADRAEVEREITQFLFQIKTGRFIDRLSAPNREAASERLKIHGRRLFDLLIRPLGDAIGKDRLVFSPAGPMNNLPFHALLDGDRYLIELYEVSYAPGAAVLMACLKKGVADTASGLFVGVTDAITPNVEIEIETIRRNFVDPVCLLDTGATVEALRKECIGKGVVHLACHGKFRRDNPGFSSLVLHNEELTANDVRRLDLNNSLIVLSACESGLNKIVGGEELLGLTSAFFSAGAGSILMSLWRIDDAATLELMSGFYQGLSRGVSISKSLRNAQNELISRDLHPFFWSPFIISGR